MMKQIFKNKIFLSLILIFFIVGNCAAAEAADSLPGKDVIQDKVSTERAEFERDSPETRAERLRRELSGGK